MTLRGEIATRDRAVAVATQRAMDAWQWGADARREARRLYDAQADAARPFVEALGARLPHWAALDMRVRRAWIALADDLYERAHSHMQPS